MTTTGPDGQRGGTRRPAGTATSPSTHSPSGCPAALADTDASRDSDASDVTALLIGPLICRTLLQGQPVSDAFIDHVTAGALPGI